MFRNYLLVAWRNMRRNKAHAFINIVGLALGMAVALVIGLWIVDEVNFNSYHTAHRRVAEVMDQQRDPTDHKLYTGPTISSVVSPVLNSGYKALFKRTALFTFQGDALFGYGDKHLSRQGVWAEAPLPEMLDFRMVEGSATALNDPSTLLINKSTATALFGTADPLNKVIKYNKSLEFKVGGVFEDIPANSDFHEWHVLLPASNKVCNYLRENTSWDNHNSQMYVELADGVTADQATAGVRSLPTPHVKNYYEDLMIYPLSRMHLYGEFKEGKPNGGLIRFVWLVGLIGGFVLLLACINFMNLSTARSEQRAREVGIRKTIGSLRMQLVGQFLGESLMIAVFSLIVALLLLQLSLPWFNEISGKELKMPWESPAFWLAAAGFTFFTGLLAGSYPAFYLSGFNAVKVLKGSFRVGTKARLPRQILVVTQFTVSLVLIIGTVMVYRQIEYARSRPTGYDRTGLITVDINTSDLSGHYDELRQEILATGVAANMAESSYSINGFWQNNNLEWMGETALQKAVDFRDVYVTPDFGRTVGWTVVKGRDFSHAFATDSNACILNEEGLKVTGFKNPVGQVVKYFGKPFTIIGIVKNMLTNGPFEKIEPGIFLGQGWLGTITIRIKPQVPMNTALATLEPVFKRRNPGSPFLYKIVDDQYARKYLTETRIGKLATLFAVLAIFISCLGLAGLASFVAEQRTREIGVRKVLGAGVFNLWSMLSRDFVMLVFISMAIAIPLAWWGTDEWLRGYDLYTTAPWWVFASAASGLLVVTLLTVSYQSIKAALMNPVQSLRTE
jgi:putative ABC transport system permease protein